MKASLISIIFLFALSLAQGCRGPAGRIDRTKHSSMNFPVFVDTQVVDSDGGRFYEMFRGERVATTKRWTGQNNTWVGAVLCSTPPCELALSRFYTVSNVTVRTETMVKGEPMVLILKRYDFQSGRAVATEWIHQNEGRSYFENFITKHNLHAKPSTEGTRRQIDWENRILPP